MFLQSYHSLMSKGVFWTNILQLKVIYIFLLSQKHLCERQEACSETLSSETEQWRGQICLGVARQWPETQEPAPLNTSV